MATAPNADAPNAGAPDAAAGAGPAGGGGAPAAARVWLDGQLCDAETASVSVFDRGLLYGDGVFTVLRGHGGPQGHAVDLAGHLDQLWADAQLLALATPARAELVRAVAEVLGASAAGALRLRVVLTAGAGPLSANWSGRGPGRVLVIAEPARAPGDGAGLRAVVLDEPRLARSARWAPKALSYQPALWARAQARARGAEEGLRLFEDDTVGEAAAANLFWVRAGRVETPPALGVRPGVTRRRVLELCAASGLAWQERPLPRAELAAVDELFVTSSIGGVVPIVELDGVARLAGPIAQQLRSAYEALAAGPLRQGLSDAP